MPLRFVATRSSNLSSPASPPFGTAEAATRDKGVNRAELAGSRRERLLHLTALPDVAGRDVGRPVSAAALLLEPFAIPREQREGCALAGRGDAQSHARSGARASDDDVTMGIRSHRLLQTSQFAERRIDQGLMLDPAAA